MPTKKLLVITTGGTIAGKVANVAVGALDEIANNLNSLLERTIGHIRANWGIEVELQTDEVANVDSSDIVPEHWLKIVEAIEIDYDTYDAFVVTHGTNTMGYTCAALSFALENIGKPVVVTGSQVPYGWAGSDALMNLENALRVATWPHEGGFRGVVCVFGSHIITGTRAKKNTEFDYDAFQSFSTPSLGRIGRIIQIDDANLRKHHGYLSNKGKPAAITKSSLVVKKTFDKHLLSFTEFPGMDPDMFMALLRRLIETDQKLVRGIVFRAFGAGDVSTNLHPCFNYLRGHEVPIVVTTQAPNGNSNFRVNTPGMELAKQKMAIAAHDMNIESITTKLMWLLGQGTSYAEFGFRMLEDLHGEISVLPETS